MFRFDKLRHYRLDSTRFKVVQTFDCEFNAAIYSPFFV
jgi:hypothetical protein